MISSMRNKKLLKAEMEDEDADLAIHLKMQEFIASKGDLFILPFLDKLDQEKFAAGKSFNLA